MYKRLSIYLSAAVLVFSACKKSEPLSGTEANPPAFVSFTNVNGTPAPAGNSTSPTKAINVFVDGVKITNVTFISNNSIPINSSTLLGTYAGLQPGTRSLVFRDTLSTSNIDYLTTSITVAAGNSYSFYLYDTLQAGRLKGILLSTNRTPDSAAKVRFLNLSPGSPALDFVLVRREAAVAKDSIVLYTGVPYLGNVPTPDTAALSAYRIVPSNVLAGAVAAGSPSSDYILRVKLTGTNTIVASTAASNLVNRRIYTFIARGKFPATTILTTLNN